MRLLKKLTISDILNNEEVLKTYKEIELYTFWEDIENKYELIGLIAEKLKLNNAIVRAVHCPNSLILTSSDIDISTNYMSICEIINYSESNEKFKRLIEFVDKLNTQQWKDIKIENDDGIDSENETSKLDNIILILHSGCEIGCQTELKKCNLDENKLEELKKLWKDYENIDIAIENITPYFDLNNNTIAKGQNCGWNNVGKWNAFTLSKKLNVKVCLDICHILASHNIMNGNANYETALDDYAKHIKDNKYNELISLFHISNYDKNGFHGAQFTDSEFDTKLVENIRGFCFEVSPLAYATLEVTEGNDVEKGIYNFNKLMLKLSEIHTSSLFGKLLEADCNKELKQFFDDMFYVYSCNSKEIFDIREKAMRIKKFVVLYTYIDLDKSYISSPFEFTKDSCAVNASMFRVQAYIYYTRFCNLAVFLSKYYNENSIIKEEHRSEDFGLALKYFMFNDDVKQVEYTGIAFHFNVNWLPRKDTFFRFYDGIDQNNLIVLKDMYMKNIIDNIRNHVQGANNSKLFSCGRNFGICLFKYCQPLNNNTPWTVRAYKDKPINFVDYDDRIYSIQAFMQTVGNKINADEIGLNGLNNFSFDISIFNSGRGKADGSLKDASSLFSLFRYYTDNIGFVETVGSISDGEIVFLKLSDHDNEYTFDEYNVIILFKAYLEHNSKEFDLNILDENLKFLIQNNPQTQNNLNFNNTKLNKEVSELLTYVNSSEKNKQDELLKLTPYSDKSETISNWFKENYNKFSGDKR